MYKGEWKEWKDSHGKVWLVDTWVKYRCDRVPGSGDGSSGASVYTVRVEEKVEEKLVDPLSWKGSYTAEDLGIVKGGPDEVGSICKLLLSIRQWFR